MLIRQKKLQVTKIKNASILERSFPQGILFLRKRNQAGGTGLGTKLEELLAYFSPFPRHYHRLLIMAITTIIVIS